jgi:hypothetical protein
MYQIYEINQLGQLVYIKACYKLDEATAYADNQRKQWAFQGQDRHFRVSYVGNKVYEN